MSEREGSSFITRKFTNLKNCESPKWLQDLLRSIGKEPISALVDITKKQVNGDNIIDKEEEIDKYYVKSVRLSEWARLKKLNISNTFC
jgi:hypothetical protein